MPPPTPSKPLRILMLHGFTQSGPLFRAKTRALEKHLAKAFPGGTTLVYPTGPLRLSVGDIPVYDNSAPPAPTDCSDLEAYAWCRGETTPGQPPRYLELDKGLERIAEHLRKDGPFDGIIGFSQGAAVAADVEISCMPAVF